MGTSTFDFRVMRGGGYEEGYEPRTERTDPVSGPLRTRALDATPRFVAGPAAIILDGSDGHTYGDWLDFYATIEYGGDSFLYKAKSRARHYEVDDESAGTASGGGGEEFALDKVFIDADTLVVKIGGTVQTLTTDYTFSGNNTAPKITTTASADTGAVTLDYEFYHQVVLQELGGGTAYRIDRGLAVPGAHTVVVEFREAKAGGHLV